VNRKLKGEGVIACQKPVIAKSIVMFYLSSLPFLDAIKRSIYDRF